MTATAAELLAALLDPTLGTWEAEAVPLVERAARHACATLQPPITPAEGAGLWGTVGDGSDAGRRAAALRIPAFQRAG